MKRMNKRQLKKARKEHLIALSRLFADSVVQDVIHGLPVRRGLFQTSEKCS